MWGLVKKGQKRYCGKLEINEKVRGEALSLEQFIEIANMLYN